MKNANRFIMSLFLLICFYSNLVLLQSIDTCTDFGPTLSNVSECVGNICYYSEILTDDLDCLPTSKSCYQFISPNSEIDPAIFSVTIVSAFFKYRSDYHYYTGDTNVFVKGYCGCPLGSSVSCSNCPINFTNFEYNTCFDGNHQDTDCLANNIPGAHGTWCLQVGVDANSDIHVNHYINQPNLIVNVVVDFNGSKWYGSFEGLEENVLENDMFKLSIRGANVFSSYTPQFTVWHADAVYSPGTPPLYLLDNTFVNGLLDCDPNKIGWFKPYLKPQFCENEDLIKSINVHSCDDNSFYFDKLYKDSGKLLQSLGIYETSYMLPETILVDNEYPLYIVRNVTSQNPYSKILFLYNRNKVLPLGINKFGIPAGDFLYTTADIRTKKTWLAYNTIWNSGVMASCDIIFDLKDKPLGLVFSATDSFSGGNVTCIFKLKYNNGTSWLTNPIIDNNCPLLWENDLSFATNTGGLECWNDLNQLITWPDFRRHNVSISNLYINTTYSPDNFTTDTEIFIPVLSGQLHYSLELKNYTIIYQNINIKPLIGEILVNGRVIYVQAKSINIPGRCYFLSNRLFLIPKLIELTTNFYNYTIEIESTVAIGDFDLFLKCGIYNVSAIVKLSLNDTFIPSIDIGNSTTWSETFNPLHWFNDSWNSMSDWKKVLRIALMVLASIVILLISFLLLPIILPIVMILLKPLSFIKKLIFRNPMKKENPNQFNKESALLKSIREKMKNN